MHNLASALALRAPLGYIKSDIKNHWPDFNISSEDKSVEGNWQSFQNIINDCVEEQIPLKKLSPCYNLPWLNKSLQSGMKRKARLFKIAKNSNKPHHWTKYQHLKRSIQRGLSKAQMGYIDNTLTEALEKKDRSGAMKRLNAKNSVVFLHLNREFN